MTDADDIAAGFVLLARCHRMRLAAIAWYVRRTAMLQGGIAAGCAIVGGAALAVAQHRGQPLAAIMAACAILNALTVALCARTAWRSIRAALVEARDVRAMLAQVEADAARFEASREANGKTLPDALTPSV